MKQAMNVVKNKPLEDEKTAPDEFLDYDEQGIDVGDWEGADEY